MICLGDPLANIVSCAEVCYIRLGDFDVVVGPLSPSPGDLGILVANTVLALPKQPAIRVDWSPTGHITVQWFLSSCGFRSDTNEEWINERIPLRRGCNTSQILHPCPHGVPEETKWSLIRCVIAQWAITVIKRQSFFVLICSVFFLPDCIFGTTVCGQTHARFINIVHVFDLYIWRWMPVHTCNRYVQFRAAALSFRP